MQKSLLDTKELYNGQADDWARTEPILLSDYSARPYVIEWCEPLANKKVLDIGCGEGYVGRELLKRGAAHVHGIDISQAMIDKAEQFRIINALENATYTCEDIRFSETTKEPSDIVLAMFLFNYLNVDETAEVMKKAYEQLKPGGYFIFSVPHPSLPYLKKDKFPFYFQVLGGYFSGRNTLFPGEIWRRDGVSVGVQCVHKTVEDYFSGLRNAGFQFMPEVVELKIDQSHVDLDPGFFTPLIDLPLHMAFKVKK